MKVSYNWLKEYVEIKVNPEKLAHLLTMAGIEVTAIDNFDNDAIFEIEVTPNRPDCLSIIGISREIAAITGKKFKLPKTVKSVRTVKSVNSVNRQNRNNQPNNLNIKILDKKGCPRYIGRSIANVKVGPSHEWLKRKLEAVGLRPVNNIVDITNYVLLETGQPLHAFDFDKLSEGKIIVRRAKAAEKIITIDGQERELNPDILVIADNKRPVAIAGVMGGKDTEVTAKTKNILLESAYFNPVLIRRGSRLLGLSSESSYRFERGVDKENVLLASMRAVNLINSLAKSELMHTKDIFTEQAKPKKIKISLGTINVNNLLGKDIAESKSIAILKHLGFGVLRKGNGRLTIEVPSFREDVTIEADLIEEISRIYGYDNIPCSLPSVRIRDIEEEPPREISNIIRDILLSQGLNEVITYGLISKDQLRKANLESQDPTDIANPLSIEQELLRPTLLAGLLNCMVNNFYHNIDDVKIFELGNIFKGTKEVVTLGIAITGQKYNDWLRRAQDKVTLFDLKGAIEIILLKLGIEDYGFVKRDLPFFKKGNSAVLKIKDTNVGFLGEISDAIINEWGIRKKGIFICEINIQKLLDFINLKKIYKPLNNFPSIKRDISLVVDKGLSAKNIINVIKQEGKVCLKNLVLVEQYTGEQIPSGSKGLVFSLEYQASDRTLKDEEVNLLYNNICEALKNKLNVKLR